MGFQRDVWGFVEKHFPGLKVSHERPCFQVCRVYLFRPKDGKTDEGDEAIVQTDGKEVVAAEDAMARLCNTKVSKGISTPERVFYEFIQPVYSKLRNLHHIKRYYLVFDQVFFFRGF